MEVFDEESGLHLPAGVRPGYLDGEDRFDGAVLDNQTGLPDEEIEAAARTYIDEHSAYGLRRDMPFELFDGGGGSMMAKQEFRTPGDIPDEIRLARHLAERDDDVAAVIGEMIGLAFSDGVKARHGDEKTQALFASINNSGDIEGALANMYREWLIAAQVSTTQLYTREEVIYELSGSDKPLSASMAAPRLGVLPSENIRVLGNDVLGTAQLAYDPDNEKLRRWLEAYFDPKTSAAQKAELGRRDRVAAAMFVGRIVVDPFEEEQLPTKDGTGVLYLLNPRIVQRSTMPKGAWRSPRPMMTRNFPLLEAKRLLNVMDFALLQGGSNFIVVAKKGTDQRPAKGREIQNLREVVRRASKVGVIVGDHRLSFEIVTPKLDELLNPGKRRLLGRKMAMSLMRVAERADDSGAEGMEAETEIFARVLTWDRGRMVKHVERNVYVEMVKRNPKLLKGPARLWLLKLILQGTQYFNDMVLKLRDRGDISRRTTVEAAGFDYEAERAERERELANGDDEILIPGVVPHTSPEQPGQGGGPQDQGGGRPPGSKKGEETGPRPKRVIAKNAGETIKAWFDEEAQRVVRMGATTMELLDDYPDREVGRLTGNERAALDLTRPEQIGSTIYVPVNPGHETAEAKAMRLADGLSVLIGYKVGGAMVAKALCFRETAWTVEQAEELAVRWGFLTEPLDLNPEDPEVDPEETAASEPTPIELHIHNEAPAAAQVLIRDGEGNVIGSQPAREPEPKPS
jgi:hypothetical protein